MSAAASAADQDQLDQMMEKNQEDLDAEGGEDDQDQDEEFKNNHDLIGVEGIIAAQKNEIDGKKVSILETHYQIHSKRK